MRQVRLGQTELQVSRIAFGTWAFGGDWGAADLEEGKAAIHRALELGINFFDLEEIDTILKDALPVWGHTPRACERSTQWRSWLSSDSA